MEEIKVKRKKREYEEDMYFEENDDDDEIELMDLAFILIRNWKLIAISTVSVLVLGSIFAFTRPDIYKAETTLMVSSGRIYSVSNLDSSEITGNQKLVTTYTEIAKSESIMRNVINKLDLDVSPGSIANSLEITPVEETEFIKISYENSDPYKAAMLVNEVSIQFMERVKQVMRIENLNIVEKARVPENAESKKIPIILAVSMVLGMMLGAFIAFMMEFLHSKLRKPGDMEKILGCSVLASIPDFTEEGENNGKK
jgi:capsular polysaccharide biosynthesis protein